MPNLCRQSVIQQGIFRCRAGVGGQGIRAAMESPKALIAPLKRGMGGLRQVLRCRVGVGVQRHFFQNGAVCATCKLLSDSCLPIFRVVVFITLISVKQLVICNLRAAPRVTSRRRHGLWRIAQYPEQSGPLSLFGALASVSS